MCTGLQDTGSGMTLALNSTESFIPGYLVDRTYSTCYIGRSNWVGDPYANRE